VFDKLSNETRFTGLSFEKAAARCSARRARLRRTLRTFASRAVFSPTYTPPEKMIPTFFALASANSARLFRQNEAGHKRPAFLKRWLENTNLKWRQFLWYR
ncbi:MAG: hypothetical protein ACLTG4_11610, partial [Oscillospiraceae bacterium]